MEQTRVSVVVVSYNTREALRRCLSQIEPEHEIVVVDNASSDHSADMVASDFPAAKLIRNDRNVGFGSANNQGMAEASGDLVLFLNSDCYAKPGAIARLADAFRAASVVAAGGRLLNPDGSLQQSSANELTLWAVTCEQLLIEKLLPRSRTFSPYWNSRHFRQTAETAQVMGACLMIRPLEHFDERFFLYCEDTELCKRLRRRGRILYVPEAQFTHDLGSSTTDRWQAIARYNRGKELYFSLHSGQAAMAACWILNRVGALLRLLIGLIASVVTGFTKPKFVQRISTFWKVLVAPLAGPPDPRVA